MQLLNLAAAAAFFLAASTSAMPSPLQPESMASKLNAFIAGRDIAFHEPLPKPPVKGEPKEPEQPFMCWLACFPEKQTCPVGSVRKPRLKCSSAS